MIAITSVIDLPFDYYRQFVIEETLRLQPDDARGIFFVDRIKGVLLGAAFGLPLLFVVLWLMNQAGSLWWLWTWVVWVAFQMLVLVLYPTFIAPLFNKFEPLKDEALASRIEALMTALRLRREGPVRDGRQPPFGARQRVFHGLRRGQAHRFLRYAARPPVGQRDRSGARA